MIELRKLGLRRGSFALKGIDLSVKAGECLVVVGHSGAGKTLLIESILGVHQLESGQVLVAGEDVTRLAPERRGFSYVPQDLSLFPHLGVGENVAFALERRGVPRERVAARVRETAGWLGIEHLLPRRSITTLSGGEKQRVALARALVAQPRALFLDEPFSALDPAIRGALYREVDDVRRRVRLTAMLVTHDFDEAFVLGDRMAVMANGSVLQVGTPTEVYDRPASEPVARLLLVENLWEAEFLGNGDAPGLARYRLRGLTVQGPTHAGCTPGSALWLGMRGHRLTLHGPGEQAACPSANCWDVTVRRVEQRPGRRIVEVEPSGAPGLLLQVAASEASPGGKIALGATVRLELPPEHVLTFDLEHRGSAGGDHA